MQRNNLLNQFNQHVNNNSNNRMFSQNAMINQNPNYSAKDTNFYNKIQIAKLEQIKRAKKIEDMGMTKKELYEHIIDPHKIEKTSKAEIDKDLNKINGMYAIEKTSQTNDFIRELWKKRTNNPYKNVIKKEQFESNYKKYYKDDIFKKDISDKKELLVHKVIKDIDADELLLESDFELLNDILEKHNDELRSIYSVSNKNKFKKDFEYAQKYKYRLEYNPKDAEELKDFYKKEQKKINKENKMLDEIIDILVEQEELSKDEIELLNKKLEETTRPSKQENNTTTDIAKQLKEELGEDIDDINEIIEELILEEELKPKKISKITSTKTKDNNNSDEVIKPKISSVKITSKTINKQVIETDNQVTGEIEQSLKDKYKNRKK